MGLNSVFGHHASGFQTPVQNPDVGNQMVPRGSENRTCSDFRHSLLQGKIDIEIIFSSSSFYRVLSSLLAQVVDLVC